MHGCSNSLTPTPAYTANTNVGTATASYTYAGDANHSGSSDSKTFAINQKSLTITAVNATKQYSDPIPAFTVTYSGFASGEGPANLGGTLACTTTATAMSGPGNYPITCSGATSSNYAIGYVGANLAVTKEDARVNYSGTTFAWTASTSSGTANVVLSATVQDITALLGDPAYDANGGDIRNATVKFVNREASDAVLCTASLALVNAADLKTAIATCNWTANIGNSDSNSFTVGTIVDGYYTRNVRTDDAVVTISKPLATNFITGGGYLVATSSAGLYASDVGSKNNMGFNVKYNKAGTNLQGKVNIIVRKGGRTYQIRSNAIDSLGVTGSNWTTPTACTTASLTTPCMAQFTSKANITDITDPLLPVSVGSGLTLQFGLTDNGEPGSTDMASITVTGGTTLYYSSNWSGSPLKTQDQLLGGGNVVVH